MGVYPTLKHSLFHVLVVMEQPIPFHDFEGLCSGFANDIVFIGPCGGFNWETAPPTFYSFIKFINLIHSLST